MYKLKKVACNLVISNQIFFGDYKLAYDITLKAYYKFFHHSVEVDKETIEEVKLFFIEEIIQLVKTGVIPKEKFFTNHFSRKMFGQYYITGQHPLPLGRGGVALAKPGWADPCTAHPDWLRQSAPP